MRILDIQILVSQNVMNVLKFLAVYSRIGYAFSRIVAFYHLYYICGPVEIASFRKVAAVNTSISFQQFENPLLSPFHRF